MEESLMLITALSVGPIGTNAYIVGCEATLEGIIVDPGGHAERILAAMEEMGLTVKYVVNTHAHFDHIGANQALVEATGATLVIHPDEVPILKASGGAAWFGLSADPSPEPGLLVHEGDTLPVGRLVFQVIHAPGHSPGHIMLFEADEGVLFDGDVLFQQGIGRSDLPGGDYATLMRSIRDKVLTLPDETVVYSGHGPATTVGQEKRLNPWL
jgi:glyoxylase-like metal-dependent hydrolase (beta-lactamase superfamily II)